MTTSIKVRVKFKGEIAEVKCLVVHPMETGAREDPETGVVAPRHHITQVKFANNGKTVMLANCSTAVARNPSFNFSFRGASPGDRFTVNWVDNLGGSDSFETRLVT